MNFVPTTVRQLWQTSTVRHALREQLNNAPPIIPPYLPRLAGTQRTIPITGNKGVAIHCVVFEVGSAADPTGYSRQKRRRNNGSPRKSEARTGLGGTGDRAVTMR